MTSDIIEQRHAAYQTSDPDRLRVTKVGLQIGNLAHFMQQGNAQKVAPIAAGLRESLSEIGLRTKG